MKKIYSLALFSLLSFQFSFAQGQQLWGVTSAGGSVDSGGTLFKIDLNGSNFAVLHSFDTLSGFLPYGSLVQAPNGLLFGTAEDGGAYEAGVIFEFDPVSHTYINDFDFDFFTDGGYPVSKLLSANDGLLYGMTSGGGLNATGTLFSFDPNSKAFTHLFDFGDSLGNYPNGYLIQATDGKLYGLTSEGGSSIDQTGILFSYDIGSSTFAVLHNFTDSTGSNPEGSLLQATNQKLYGMTSRGGLYDFGAIFSYNLSNNVYTDIYDFNDTTGSAPFGSLIEASDGLLYGVTSGGGANDLFGTIFSFDPTINNYTDLFDFNGANGSAPEGELMQASNSLLYGMAQFGGASDAGVIFSFDQTNRNYTVLHEFNVSDGQYPTAGLIELTFTGIPDNGHVKNFQLYPNPVSHELRIKGTGLQIDNIDIYDVVGQRVYSQLEAAVAGTTIIDVSGLSQGIYFVHVRQLNDKWVGRFVKE